MRNKKAHEHSHYRFTGITRRSLRNGFNGFLRARPGDRALLSPSPRNAKHCRELISASGYRAHTTSPSAFAPFVLWRKNVHRIPPNVRDDGQRPLSGETGRSCRIDLPDGLSGIFLQKGLDTQAALQIDLPVGQISRPIGINAEVGKNETTGISNVASWYQPN